MTDDPTDHESHNDPVPLDRRKRVLQAIGAAVVTAIALYYLFGIPAYLLFKNLFG